MLRLHRVCSLCMGSEVSECLFACAHKSTTWERLSVCLRSRVRECVFLLVPLTFVHMQGSNVMEDQDLRDIGITDPGHRKKILHAARSLPKVVNIIAQAQHREKTLTDSVWELKGQNIALLLKIVDRKEGNRWIKPDGKDCVFDVCKIHFQGQKYTTIGTLY